jgi:hypothetical protein
MNEAPPLPASLTQVAPARWRAVRGVLTDIDDTLTRHGAIEPAARDALRQLSVAGVPVIAITGRPMGWSEPFVRDGTLPAIVAENGAVALFREGDALRVEFAQDQATRHANRARLRRWRLASCARCPGRRSRPTASAAPPTSRSTTASSCTSTRRASIAWWRSCTPRA